MRGSPCATPLPGTFYAYEQFHGPGSDTTPPVKKPSWNSRGDNSDQVNFLLGEIERLKADHRISGASVIVHWTLRRVQPLQRWVHLGFQYTREEDPTRYTRAKISKDELKDRVAELLKNIVWKPSLSGTFRAGWRPWEVLLRVVYCSLNRVVFVK